MPKELNLNKRTLKLLAMLIVLFLGVLTVDAISKADGRKAGQEAVDNVSALFKVDFRRPLAAQLPPCTETGQAFWTAHLGTIKDVVEAQGATIQSVRAERSGQPEPYNGIGGEGQIVPLRLTLTTLDKAGQPQTSTSEVRVLMIQGTDGQWLLDGLAVDLPSQ